MKFVGNLLLFAAVKDFANRSRIDKVIAMVRVAPFFDSRCIYSAPAQETAKDRAKFGWPPASDMAAVTEPRRETR